MSQREHKRKVVARARRVIVKIGSQVLSSAQGIEEKRMQQLVRELAALHDTGREIVVVSSGAVAAGMSRLGMKERPKSIPQKQALAAVGQIRLMAFYERYFSEFHKIVAQILLTQEDLASRRRYLNAKHTLQTLLESDIVPIVNENDTVTVEELKFGDNDHLSSLVATLLEADLLVLLSDVDGVYDRDPRSHAEAQLLPVISDAYNFRRRLKGEAPGPYGTGGIASKIGAAEKAAASGIPTVIASGLRLGILPRLLDAEQEEGTLVLPQGSRIANRKHWIAYNLRPAGEIVVDQGAHDALVNRGRSLLPSGLQEVRGSFGVGDCVCCLDPQGREFARGLVNYSARELNQIKGMHTSKIEKILGYRIYDEIIHRNDFVLLQGLEGGDHVAEK